MQPLTTILSLHLLTVRSTKSSRSLSTTTKSFILLVLAIAGAITVTSNSIERSIIINNGEMTVPMDCTTPITADLIASPLPTGNQGESPMLFQLSWFNSKRIAIISDGDNFTSVDYLFFLSIPRD